VSGNQCYHTGSRSRTAMNPESSTPHAYSMEGSGDAIPALWLFPTVMAALIAVLWASAAVGVVANASWSATTTTSPTGAATTAGGG
jgi:hypothetical protein